MTTQSAQTIPTVFGSAEDLQKCVALLDNDVGVAKKSGFKLACLSLDHLCTETRSVSEETIRQLLALFVKTTVHKDMLVYLICPVDLPNYRIMYMSHNPDVPEARGLVETGTNVTSLPVYPAQARTKGTPRAEALSFLLQVAKKRRAAVFDRLCGTPLFPNREARIANRRNWPKFGQGPINAANRASNEQAAATGAEGEVFMEAVASSTPVHRDCWCGPYVTDALERGWSRNEIDSIQSAPDPHEIWTGILKKKYSIMSAQMKAEEHAKMKAAGLLTAEEIAAAAPRGPMGLGARMTMLRTNGPAEREAKGGLSQALHSRQNQSQQTEQASTLFVRELPDDYDEEDVRARLQEQNLSVRRVHVVRYLNEETGEKELSGKAFVVFTNVAEAQRAMTYLNGAHWEHSVIEADFAADKPKRH